MSQLAKDRHTLASARSLGGIKDDGDSLLSPPGSSDVDLTKTAELEADAEVQCVQG